LAGNFSGLEREIIRCRRCPRLVEWRERVGREKVRAHRAEAYWARPVPGFGDEHARVLAVGLAPGAHGSNRTGRMFTGDASGGFLFPALWRAGFADRPESVSRGDGLELRGLFLTAVCRCVPPGNKPTAEEIRNCLPFLEEEIRLLDGLCGVVALGKIAYDAVMRMFAAPPSGLASPAFRGPRCNPAAFAHGRYGFLRAPGESGAAPLWILASYHPSRQTTQTGRLTRAMFDRIWRKVRRLASAGDAA
jgi:uracil-DNA glycosylase family 4